jgi:hypothetical protein
VGSVAKSHVLKTIAPSYGKVKRIISTACWNFKSKPP